MFRYCVGVDREGEVERRGGTNVADGVFGSVDAVVEVTDCVCWSWPWGGAVDDLGANGYDGELRCEPEDLERWTGVSSGWGEVGGQRTGRRTL